MKRHGTICWEKRGTTPPARPTTRWRSVWGWATPGARYWSRSPGAAGGEATGRRRSEFGRLGAKLGVPVVLPSISLSTDNAAMIAAAGYLKYLRKEFSGLDLNAEVELRLGGGPVP